MAKSEAIMGGSAGISPRKAMASGMGDGSGKFGVSTYDSVQRPCAVTGVKGSKELGDGERGIGGSVSRGKGMHPGQAAPNHGSTHPMGKGMGHYGGKV